MTQPRLRPLLVLAALATSCSAANVETVTPQLEIVNQTHSALAANTITSIGGTYSGTCDGRDAMGTDTWTLSVSGGPAVDELSVRKNDSDCILSVSNIVAGSTFVGAPAMVLNNTNTYEASSSAFAVAASPLSFYANAKISALTFAANFTITLLVSDAPSASAVPDKAADFATETGAVSAGTVLAPDYAIDYGSFSLTKDVNDVVQSVAGYAQLTAGSVAGQNYAVCAGALTGASSLTDVETAYGGATTTGLLSSLTTLRLPASGYGLVTANLDTTTSRTVIIRNTDQGVSSYQLFLVTFTP